MALTRFQRELCRLIAANRRQTGESYVAGGVALNTLLGCARISRDIGLFHDTTEALRVSWPRDRALIESAGYQVEVVRESLAFVEAVVSATAGERTDVQWVRDSAFRFFPLVEDGVFGLVLHPFDLATNKVLALVGRLEPRDWVDVVECHGRLQPLGYLAWAACGKDPGFGPSSLLAEARRGGHYPQADLDALAFEGRRPDAAELGRRWHSMLFQADRLVQLLPAAEVGKAVLMPSGEPYRLGPDELARDLGAGAVMFHEGRIRGVWPAIGPAR